MTIHRPTLQDIIEESGKLNKAEERFRAACKSGERSVLGDEVPTEPTKDNTLRASLIRHMMLGGCKDMPVGPKGGQVRGAWIIDVLDLHGCDSKLDLYLGNCHFVETPMLRDARLGALYLPGCHLPGLDAHRLKTERSVLLNQKFKSVGALNLSSANIGLALDCIDGSFDGADGTALNCNGVSVGADIFLSVGFKAAGEVNLIGAQIAGQLVCNDASFDGKGGTALDCDAINVGADVFLRDKFNAMGEVSLVRAQIAGQLACTDGSFDGRGGTALNCDAISVGADIFLRGGFKATGHVNLVGAQIVGSLRCKNATFAGILACEGMRVSGGFDWRQVKTRPRALILTDAYVASLRDDKDSWQGCTPILHGFRYDRIISDMSVGQRLKWLARGLEPAIEPTLQMGWNDLKDAKAFDPQPYVMLARTLNAQGNASGAARVLVARGHRQAKARYFAAQAALDGSLEAGWSAFYATLKRPADAMFGLVFGYGHQPARALLAVFVIWLACFNLYGAAYDAGQMAPNSDVVITSADWVAGVNAYDACTTPPCEMPLRAWEQTPSYQDYETFNRGLYALDLFVPLDALGQENAWAPSKDRGTLGWFAYYLRWLVQLSGWVITAIGAAALTGVIGKRD